MAGELTFEMDHREGIIRVRGTGMWTPEQASAHFVALHHAIESLRAIRQSVFVLVDLSGAVVQTAAVAEEVRAGTARIYGETDFVALIAGTALLAMQMKYVAKAPNMAVFSEMAPAMGWIQARRAELGV